MLIVYAGDVQCDFEARGNRCSSKAKYRIGGRHTQMKYYCTAHSKKDTVMRRELPEHPHPNELSEARTGQYVTQAGVNAQTRKEKLSSTELAASCVQCGRISMKKERDFLPPEGWICIFPNNYHGHGFGWGFGDFSGLSPMQLGPVNSHHHQPGHPLATCIENRHQFEKVEVLDMDLEGPLCGCDRHLEWPHCAPNKDFDKLRVEGFVNPKPVRHKHQKAKLKSAQKKFSKERPGLQVRYAVHRDPAGRDCHYTYLESRYFYCKDTEILALKSPAFQRLVELRKEGYQMILCGYDGYPFASGITPQSAYEAFIDEAAPFGHERVLAVLLTAHENPDWHLPNDYPWYRYFAEHLDVYVWERRQMKFQRLASQKESEGGESAQKKAKTEAEDEKK